LRTAAAAGGQAASWARKLLDDAGCRRGASASVGARGPVLNVYRTGRWPYSYSDWYRPPSGEKLPYRPDRSLPRRTVHYLSTGPCQECNCVIKRRTFRKQRPRKYFVHRDARCVQRRHVNDKFVYAPKGNSVDKCLLIEIKFEPSVGIIQR
jgi:hypothetical protein